MTKQPKPEAFKHQSPEISLAGAVGSMILRDVTLIADRLESATTGTEAFGYRDALRYSTEELAEAMLSCAATASLIGYGIQGDKWRLTVIEEFSAESDKLISELDRLKAALASKEEMIRRYILSAKSQIFAKRSIALLSLSLDAVSRRYAEDFKLIAGISRGSLDVIGDAQAAAEEYDRTGTIPLHR